MILAVRLSYMAFIIFRYVPSIPTLLRVFIINGCWILSNAFSVYIDMIMSFLKILFIYLRERKRERFVVLLIYAFID